jgi:hypothetical protein
VPGNYNAIAVKPVRWTRHALQNLADREIDPSVVDVALAQLYYSLHLYEVFSRI